MTPSDDHTVRINLRPMSSVQDDVPTLVWEPKPGYPGIAVGTLAIFGGRPAAGKSTAARGFVAEVTNGTLPGAWHGTPVSAAWIGTEESEVYMMKPGLRAAGADMDRVLIPEVQFTADDGTDADAVSILRHLDMRGLAAELKANGVRLVVIDPIMAVIGSATDVNRSNEVRARLEPWVKLAEHIDGVVIGIAHLKKSFTGDVVAALNGSSAFGEVARSIFGFAKDDSADDGTRLMSHAKSSIGPESLSYTYTLEPVEVTTDSGKTAAVSKFVLGEETDRTVSDALREAAAGPAPLNPADKPLTDKAATLVSILTGPHGKLLELTKDAVIEQMGEAGYNADQTRRAREELAKRCRIGKPFRKETPGPYYWQLLHYVGPDQGQDGNEDGTRTTRELPSCHPGSDQQVSTCHPGEDGKDGRLADSPRARAANHDATVTAIDSRRSHDDTKQKVSARVWFDSYVAQALADGAERIDSFAAIAAGAAVGYGAQSVRVAASAHPAITAIRTGTTTTWSLTGEQTITAAQFVDDYLDALPANTPTVDQDHFYAAAQAAGLGRDTARKALTRSRRIDSVPAHGQAKSERVWQILTTADEVTA